MINRPGSDTLVPFDFDEVSRNVPEIEKFGFNLSAISFNPSVCKTDWSKLTDIPGNIFNTAILASRLVCTCNGIEDTGLDMSS